MHIVAHTALTRRASRMAIALAAVVASVAACGTGGMSGMDHGSMASASSSPSGMSGMDDMPTGDGSAAAASGLTFTPTSTSLTAGKAASLMFQIRGGDGRPVTSFARDQTKLMHFYLIRSDLTGFQHLHPAMAADGTWSALVQPLLPGSYRVYASFIANTMAGKQSPVVLGDKLTVAGTASTTPLPAPAATTQVDGYTITLSGGDLMAGMTHTLNVALSKGGTPVTDLQPYLDTYAHLTAFHDGDLAFAHLHPQGTVTGEHGGPTLTFEAMLSRAGNWRLFLQFQTAGTLHTAAITLAVGG